MSKTRRGPVSSLVEAATGHPVDDSYYVGKKLWPRATGGHSDPGLITATSLCTLEGCGGTRLHVRWPDGTRTYPCAKGCTVRPDGDLQVR